MIYSLVPRLFADGTLCVGIGLLVIAACYVRAWHSLQDKAKVIASSIPDTQVSPRRKHWPELRYLQWGVLSSAFLHVGRGGGCWKTIGCFDCPPLEPRSIQQPSIRRRDVGI
jgi:hypothetical protein